MEGRKNKRIRGMQGRMGNTRILEEGREAKWRVGKVRRKAKRREKRE